MAPCLSDDEIEELAKGTHFSATWPVPVADHIKACDACHQRLKARQKEVGFLEDLRRACARPSALLPDEVDSSVPSGYMPDYEIQSELHRGGQGVVYEAIQLSTRRKVAVKVILEGPFAGQHSRWRFEREVRLAAALRHPHIVTIHDSGIAHGRYFFALDYVDGQPLDAYARLAKPSIRQLVELVCQVCDAIAYAHRHGVIHRDLKPTNILVDEEGKPYVVDFGLAKAIGEDSHESRPDLVTMPGGVMGTLAYMSPEQTQGDPDQVDARTDLYSLGVMLYELLTGSAPYKTNCDMAEALNNIRQTDPPRPSKISRALNSELDAIILRAMAKEPDRRYGSVSELQADLEAWLDGKPVAAKSDSSLYMLRKLALKHYFHTSVIATLIVALIGFGAISTGFYRKEQDAVRELDVVNRGIVSANQQLDARLAEADRTLHRHRLGWFLREWESGRMDTARLFVNTTTASAPASGESNRGPASRVPEDIAIQFLLDPSYPLESLLRDLPSEPALAYLAAGERELEAGRVDEAVRLFRLSVETRPSYWPPVADARLRQLLPSPTATTQRAEADQSKKGGQ